MRLAEINGKYYRPCATVVYDKQGRERRCFWDDDKQALCSLRSNGCASWVVEIPNDKWFYDYGTDSIRIK